MAAAWVDQRWYLGAVGGERSRLSYQTRLVNSTYRACRSPLVLTPDPGDTPLSHRHEGNPFRLRVSDLKGHKHSITTNGSK